MIVRYLIDRLAVRRRGPQFSAPLQPDVRVYAVGDIHGRHDLLMSALARIDGDLAGCDGPSALVFLGDYVDRGAQSAQVLEKLRALPGTSPTPVVTLMGNHERMMLDFLADPVSCGRLWLHNGGLTTMASFGIEDTDISDPDALGSAAADLRAALPAGLEIWLSNLPLLWRSGNLVCVHAALDPRLAVAGQADTTMIWGHPDFRTTPRRDGIWVAHGHTVVDVPEMADGRIALDTGAHFSGLLTVGVLEQGTLRTLT